MRRKRIAEAFGADRGFRHRASTSKQAPPLAIERARAGLRRHRRRDARRARPNRSPRSCGDMVKAEGAAPAVSVIGLVAEDLAAACGARQRRRLARARFRFHLHAGPARWRRSSRRCCRSPKDRRDASRDARGVHRRLRGLLAVLAAPTRPTTAAAPGMAPAPSARSARPSACARLMKLPAAAIPDVIGIAVSMASGVNANYGTMTKPLHAGHAARNGMAAAHARQARLQRNAAALEGRGGFFATFARGTRLERRAVRRSRPEIRSRRGAASSPSAIRAAA